MPGKLELRSEARGRRYYLDGQPVVGGDSLELQRPDGSWTAGHYAWDAQKDGLPLLLLSERRAIVLASWDILRWPDSVS